MGALDAGQYGRLVASIRAAARLRPNWDSYGADPPSPVAVHWAEETLRIFESSGILPDRADPSVEGGISIAFTGVDKYADLECFNTGEIVATLWRRDDNPEIWELPADARDIEQAANKIRSFLGSGSATQTISTVATPRTTIYAE
jgi:hypothetical protein